MRRLPWLLACSLGVGAALPAQGVSLVELPALLRARSERQRAEQIEKLQPYLAELALDYRRNAEVLDDTIASVAALGDGIVPLMLENLVPAKNDAASRDLAENSARVLARLDPQSFLEPLLELVDSDRPLTQRLAIDLLGHCSRRHQRAGKAVARVFPELEDPVAQRVALRAAQRLETPLLIGAALPLLTAEDPKTRVEAARYLRAARAQQAVPPVVAALPGETDNDVLPELVGLLIDLARADQAATEAVLPLVLGVRLDPEDLLALVSALGDIAPEGHQKARDALREVIRQDTSRLGVAAALSLQKLGDRKGVRELFDQLDEKLRRRGRNSADAHADLGDAHAAFGRWREAIKAYEKAIQYSRTDNRRTAFWLSVARCEAHLDNPRRLVRALEKADVSRAMIEREAENDPVFVAALGKDLVQKYLRSLGRR